VNNGSCSLFLRDNNKNSNKISGYIVVGVLVIYLVFPFILYVLQSPVGKIGCPFYAMKFVF
jgi:hypothetical protein